MNKNEHENFQSDGVQSFNVLLAELMSNLLHNLPGIAYRCRNDSKWTMIFLSEGCHSLTEYQPEDLLYNSNLSYEDIIYEDDRPLVRHAVNTSVNNRKQFQMTYRIVTRTGKIKWVWEQGNAIYEDNDKPRFLDGFITDFNMQRQNEERLQQNAEQLAELNIMKDRFFTIMAHDLQNPIYSMITLSDFLQQNIKNFTCEEVIDFTKQLNHSAKSIYTLLENLLIWSRSQTGKLRIQKERVSLKTLLDNCLEDFSGLASSKNIKYNIDISTKLFLITDSSLLQTIVRNMISNAIKYSHPNSEIFIESKPVGGKIELKIKDQGIGMSRDHTENLFSIDSDYRSMGTMNETGSGLGLILVKDLLSRLGGSIKVESKLNEGSIFTIRI